MADFNPQVSPTNPQEYLNTFRSVDAPTAPHLIADTSTGEALKTVGEGLGAFKIADTFMQNKVKNEATTGVDAIRDITTRTLETATQPQNVIPQPAQTATGAKVSDNASLLDSNASMDVPNPVQDGLSRASTLVNARDASSGRNDTLYTQQLNSLAVKLRTQYPGYRPYIDEQISQMTGMNPANAYVNSLLADAKASQTSKEKIFTSTLADLHKVDGKVVDGVASNEMIDHFIKTGDVAGANKFIFKANALSAAAADKTALVTSQNQDETTLKTNIDSISSQKLDDMFNMHMYAASVSGGVDTPSALAAKVQAAQMNPGSSSAQEQQVVGIQLQGYRNSLEADMRFQMGQTVIDPTTKKPALDSQGQPYSWSSKLGDAAVDQKIKNKLKGYDTIIDATVNKLVGTAGYSATHAQRFREDLDNHIVSDPDNIALSKLDWMNQHLGATMGNAIMANGLVADVDNKLKNLLNDNTKNMFVPPALNNGKISTFKGDVEKAIKGDTTGGPVTPDTKYYDRLVDNIKYIVDPNMPDSGKMAAAQYYFRPEGRHVLQDFKQGYYTDNTGKPVPDSFWNAVTPGLTKVEGREAVWDKMTSKDVSDNIARLSKLPGGQQVAKNYVDWAEDEHHQMVRDALVTLNGIHNDDMHLQYKSDGTLALLNSKEELLTPRRAGEWPIVAKNLSQAELTKRNALEADIEKAQPILDRLNQVGKNMQGIQDSFGNKEGMSSYYLNLLQKEGFRPGEDTKGMPQKFYDAIVASHKSNRIEDVFKKGLGNNQ